MLKLSKLLVYLLVSVLLGACAVTYKAAEDGAAGFRDLEIGKNIFYVEYTEGARTPWEQIHRFTLKRCAEITKQKGYTFFDVLEKDQKTVYLETDVKQISIATMGNHVNSAPVVNTYTMGGQVEGRRVIYKIQLVNE